MKFGIENSVISSYKRLSYEVWYAFAEFVDNSTQAYFDNRDDLDPLFRIKGQHLKVEITYNRDDDFVIIRDNSIGMDEDGLDRALKVGLPPDTPHPQRSKYGLGMKTAACWFGNKWSIRTKKLGSTKGYFVQINVDEIAKEEGEVDLPPTVFESEKDEHFTEIRITDLNRKFIGRTITKIKEYLGSIYRFDIDEGIEILWNGTKLSYKRFEDELYVDANGERYKKRFEFDINGKSVTGWVGVLGKGFGSRKKAGFSIIQNKRVIQGWPNSYKPASIFGEQEDGSNDLVNQRVVGELFLDNFSVSHTKDKIVWEANEEEDLDKKLGEVCAEARDLALTLRFTRDEQKDTFSNYILEASSIIAKELQSQEFKTYLRSVAPFPEKIIKSNYELVANRVVSDTNPSLNVNIGLEKDQIKVLVFFSEVSELEPYVLLKTIMQEGEIVVVINLLHPIIKAIQSTDVLLEFFRHCIYDGVSEWKAYKLNNSIEPFTVKFIKDGLLRVPFEIKTNQTV